MVLTLLTSTVSLSQETEIEGVPLECQPIAVDIVGQCNAVIMRAQEYIESQREESELQKALSAKQGDVIKAQKEELDAFYRNPYIMGLLGAATAAILIKK